MTSIHKIDDIDWDNWEPQQKATLLFVIRDGKILLIEKKRGLGAGKINGVGGRMEPGETPEQTAVRETEEELCITPESIEYCGELSFQFIDGLSIHVFVFRTECFSGEPTETEEANPLWCELENIPYDKMWKDDALWIPLMLKGERFHGRFVFDDDKMLDYRFV